MPEELSADPIMGSRHVSARPQRLRLAGVVLALFASLLGAAFARADDARASVLILISRNPGDTWAVAELDGMLRGLGAARPAVAAVAEYMDIPFSPRPGAEEDLREYYRQKFARDQFRVVLVADAPALEFAVKNRDELFPAAQVVFCGIAKVDDSMRVGHPWLTGVIENTDPAACLRLALALQPDLERLVILDDSTASGRGNLVRIQRDMPEESKRVQLELLRVDTVRALFTGVEHLPPRSAVLLTRAQVARRMGSELLARCPVPIYGQRAPTHLGAMVAGAVIDGERHGEAAARLGLRLLAGQSAADIPLVADVPTRFIADYAQMRRFNLPLAALPAGTEMVNRPRTVFEQYPVATRVAIGALLLLSLTAAWLAGALLQKRRKATALKESLSLLNATMDAAADGVLVVDSNGRVSWFNRRFVELWSIPEELVGRRDDATLLDFMLQQVREPEAFLRRVRELYATPDAEIKDTIEFADGRVFERRSSPQRLDGKIIGRVWNFEDVTARRRAEDANRQLEARLAHTHRLEALGTLAGGIAHDFNNLLTAIFGYAHLAQDTLGENHPARPDLDAVLTASARARDLVRQILTFSRKTPFERRPIRLEAVVRDAIRLLRPAISSAIEIEAELSDARGTVLADSSQVHQAILNLGNNAAQAMRDQPGTITIRLEQVTVGGAIGAEHRNLDGLRCLCVTVQDAGPGMDAETLRRVFDPFFTTKAPGEGTGLGLAVVHGIMQNHDGAVSIESVVGEGTSVRLFFPLTDEEAEIEAAAPAAQPPVAAGMRVLVVDDEAAVLRVAEMSLRRLGFDVVACASPAAALDRLRAAATPFEVLVTDLNMPQMSGLELAAQVRALDREIVIVLATGFLGDGALEERAAAAGIEVVMGKPFTPAILVAAIRRAVELSIIRRGLPPEERGLTPETIDVIGVG